MIINYASSIVNKLETLLTDNTRVIVYDHYVFKVQATVNILQIRPIIIFNLAPLVAHKRPFSPILIVKILKNMTETYPYI